MAIRRRTIQTTAQNILDNQRISTPPVPIERLGKALGLQIKYESLKGDLSGFLYREGKVAVIGVNTHHSAARQRFTIAHELGHLLLHEQQPVYVDHDFQLRLRSTVSSQGTDREEVEANLFAAELLMPKSFLERDLEKTEAVDLLDSDVVATLAKKYGVSTQALLIRLAALGYVAQ